MKSKANVCTMTEVLIEENLILKLRVIMLEKSLAHNRIRSIQKDIALLEEQESRIVSHLKEAKSIGEDSFSVDFEALRVITEGG